ncbi:FACT complex subunit [Starmerella bacillaris]|uniref:FACT complex subunit POB3 n=1 Tax=Starmerella bacillaris TaxID=1247836 RepID=A0AAV5RHS9_STABA|nr:FACT complex subunit [Starmerella bacillaris]
MSTQYDGIYFNQSRVSGEVRMSTDGLGWRATQKLTAGSNARVSQPFLLPASDLLSASWSRGAHNYLVQIHTRNGDVVSLDGFEQDDFQSLQRSLSSNLDLQLEHKEYSLRGWNWGKTELENNELVFNVASKPDFEIPYAAIASTNVVGKAEVAVEIALPSQAERTTNGDEVVEVRFFVPSAVVEPANVEGNEGSDVEVEEPVNAAQQFHDQLQEKANIGSVSGSEIAQFSEVLFTTPRGRYDIMFFQEAFRLHGKTYDYMVPYTSIKRIFALPRLDELHDVLVLQLEPPLRQGQTRYPFLVMQFPKEDQMEIELNVEDDLYKEFYEGKIERSYNATSESVVSSLFKGLSGREITSASSFKSTRNLPAVPCLIKAAEAALYPLDKGFLIVTKTPQYIKYSEVTGIRMSRLATGNRSFDLTLSLRQSGSQASEIALNSVSKEEQPILEHFFESKNLKTNNDAAEQRKGRNQFEEDVAMGDDDDESDDEDFDEEPPSDSEEDSDESGSGSGSGSGSDAESEEESDGEYGSDNHVDTGDSKIATAKKDRKRVKKE